jgi:hypothetical protein
MNTMLQTSELEAFERSTIPQPWPDAEVARLFALRQVEGRDWGEIALALGRTESGVKSKYKYELHSRECRAPSVPYVREPVPSEVLAEQARRLTAWYRSQAGALFGDPPVGCSALDRRVVA